jgi:hypothetical protein
MIPSRDARVTHTDGQVVVNTYNVRPTLERCLFLFGLIPWIGIGLFSIMGLSGFISPETLTTPVRIVLGFFSTLWLGGGSFLMWERFLNAFSRAEIVADNEGVHITREFFFGSTRKNYSWSRIEYVSDCYTTNSPCAGVVMRAGRWLTTIESRLPSRTAREISESLLLMAPNTGHKLCVATPSPPPI